MEIKIALMVLLAASFLMFGCAGKGSQTAAGQPSEISASDGGEPAVDNASAEEQQPAAEEQPAGQPPAEQPAETGSDGSELADLFQIDTDKPISDEGLDVSTPSSD